MGADREYRVVLRTKSRVTLGRGESIEFVEPKAEVQVTLGTVRWRFGGPAQARVDDCAQLLVGSCKIGMGAARTGARREGG